MKLYATSTNGKTKKGIGDDSLIMIDLALGNHQMATIYYYIENNTAKLMIKNRDDGVQIIELPVIK